MIPVQFTCGNCGYDVPWIDAGLYHYEHRNQCPECSVSKHIMFGTPTLKPCDGLMRPVGIIHGYSEPLLTTECETCGFRWVTYHEDHWATLTPVQQTALINLAYLHTERKNHHPTIIYKPSPEYCTPPPPIPAHLLNTRTRVTRRP